MSAGSTRDGAGRPHRGTPPPGAGRALPRLYIFDADGTLRRTTVPGRACPLAPGEWELMPGVRERLRAIPFGPDGPFLAVASNQDHVGYGQIPLAAAVRLLEDMVREATAGAVAAHVELCPHRIEDGCSCRKPAPGMLLRILRRFGVPPKDALFVGDSVTDAEAARRAGVPFAWAWEFFGPADAPPGSRSGGPGGNGG